mgnify:FL=1
MKSIEQKEMLLEWNSNQRGTKTTGKRTHGSSPSPLAAVETAA